MRRPLSSTTPPRSPRARGFTLIELVIVVIVIAVLAAIAMPSLLGAIRKGRRSEAIAALTAVQQAEERFRANNLVYSANLIASPAAIEPNNRGLGLSDVTPNKYYSINLVEATATGYKAVARANPGTSQASDTPCATLGVMVDRGNLKYAGGGPGSTLAADAEYAASNDCWAR
jgi:type IV pilus assembly protein PilE